jgi:uncharacterized protein (TIGR03066 family)
MRMILGCALMAVLVVGVSAEDKEEKIDTKKLIGKWEPKEEKKHKVIIEFTKDGKVIVSFGDDKHEGTYKVDGNKLTTMVKADETKTITITKLTDTEMVTMDENKAVTFLRLKDK